MIFLETDNFLLIKGTQTGQDGKTTGKYIR